MTTLRFPDEVAVSGDALVTIAAILDIPVTAVFVNCDGDTSGGSTYDLKAGGWIYERPDDEMDTSGDLVLAAGVTGYAVGSRWTGGAR